MYIIVYHEPINTPKCLPYLAGEVGNIYTTLQQIIQEYIYICISNFIRTGPRFIEDTTKTFWCSFQFKVPIAVDLQNINAVSQSDVETLFR